MKVLVTLDADAQRNPSEIPKLVAPILNKEADIVIGSGMHAHAVATDAQDGWQKLLDASTAVRDRSAGLWTRRAVFRAYSEKAVRRWISANLGWA